jgi:NADPH:quinone reductase-like Zn-dependent oxidoreductase
LGATHVLARDEVPSRLSQAVKVAAAGRAADLIFDRVGASYLEANIAALALQGRLCCISTISGARGTLDLGALLHKRLTVMGSAVRTRSASEKARLVRDFTDKAMPRFARGELIPVVGQSLPLAQAQAAHELLERNEVVGKVVLVV